MLDAANLNDKAAKALSRDVFEAVKKVTLVKICSVRFFGLGFSHLAMMVSFLFITR
jgi:hypothetical protein